MRCYLSTQLGRLCDAMGALGLSSSTIPFFTSTSGWDDYRITHVSNTGIDSTGPLYACKHSSYEGGLNWRPTVCRLAGVEGRWLRLAMAKT